jgi:hypothetical protein
VTRVSTTKGVGMSPDMLVSTTRLGTSTGQGWERDSWFWDESEMASFYIYRDRSRSRPYLNHGAGASLMLWCNE